MEQGEKGCESKAEQLINSYQNQFLSIRYTVHPSGIPGEARGKSSNVAWAVNYYVQHWFKQEESECELITVADGGF